MYTKKQHIARKTIIILITFVWGVITTVLATGVYDTNVQSRANAMVDTIKSNASTMDPLDVSSYYSLVRMNISSLMQVLTVVDGKVAIELWLASSTTTGSITGWNQNTGSTNNNQTPTQVQCTTNEFKWVNGECVPCPIWQQSINGVSCSTPNIAVTGMWLDRNSAKVWDRMNISYTMANSKSCYMAIEKTSPSGSITFSRWILTDHTNLANTVHEVLEEDVTTYNGKNYIVFRLECDNAIIKRIELPVDGFNSGGTTRPTYLSWAKSANGWTYIPPSYYTNFPINADWICNWDGSPQMFCRTAQLSRSCTDAPPLTPRSGISYKQSSTAHPICSTGFGGPGCLCVYNAVDSQKTPLYMNTALLYDDNLAMRFMEPVWVGKILKTLEYTEPINMDDPTVKETYGKMVDKDIADYVRNNWLIMREASDFGYTDSNVCSIGNTVTLSSVQVEYDKNTRIQKNHIYSHDFKCVEWQYLKRSLNKTEFDYPNKIVKITLWPIPANTNYNWPQDLQLEGTVITGNTKRENGSDTSLDFSVNNTTIRVWDTVNISYKIWRSFNKCEIWHGGTGGKAKAIRKILLDWDNGIISYDWVYIHTVYDFYDKVQLTCYQGEHNGKEINPISREIIYTILPYVAPRIDKVCSSDFKLNAKTNECTKPTKIALNCTDGSTANYWYKHYLGRCGEQAGLNYWNGQIWVNGATSEYTAFKHGIDSALAGRPKKTYLDDFLCESGSQYLTNSNFCTQN